MSDFFVEFCLLNEPDDLFFPETEVAVGVRLRLLGFSTQYADALFVVGAKLLTTSKTAPQSWHAEKAGRFSHRHSFWSVPSGNCSAIGNLP